MGNTDGQERFWISESGFVTGTGLLEQLGHAPPPGKMPSRRVVLHRSFRQIVWTQPLDTLLRRLSLDALSIWTVHLFPVGLDGLDRPLPFTC